MSTFEPKDAKEAPRALGSDSDARARASLSPRGKALALKSLAFSSQSDLEAGTFHIAHELSRVLNYKLVPENGP